MEVYESVHRVELNLPFQETPILNVYIIKNNSSAAIIDTGMGDAASNQLLIKGVEEIGLRKNDISLIINTHEHVEHFSGNYELAKATGAQIVAHPIAKKTIEKPSMRFSEEAVLKMLPEGALEQIRRWSTLFNVVKPSTVAKIVKDGDTFEPVEGIKLRVIHTPGHSQGHICLYDEDRKALFSGDQVLGSGTPYVGKWPDGSNGDMDDYLASLEKLKKLNLKLILPGHGPIVTEPYERIQDTIERKMKREDMIIRSLRSDRSKDLFALTREVYGGPRGEVYYYSSCVLAYLSRLKKQGKADYTFDGSKILCKLTE
jgi:glyoxylase-like metal-dependent hydrolase (beta-lactamase superfamily II)